MCRLLDSMLICFSENGYLFVIKDKKVFYLILYTNLVLFIFLFLFILSLNEYKFNYFFL